jgi:hypothetical protein
MKSYVLFVFGEFQDHEDVEFFCDEILSESDKIISVRYIIENTNNIIIIFDSEHDYKILSEELFSLIALENIRLYFLFERSSLICAHIPVQVKDFIFKPNPDIKRMDIEYDNFPKKNMDLDELLEKIKTKGIDSLTESEKNFLDNFEN